jgi:hypothetical protein
MYVYICFCCGYPIIFRGHPPRVYHLGTGWPCWYLQQAGLCGPGLFPNLKIPSVTPKSEYKELLNKAEELYKEYVSTSDASPILEFIKGLLKVDHGDCVRGFLVHIAGEAGKLENALVRKVVSSAEWQGFTCRLRIKRLYRDYLDTGDASLVLRFIEVQSKSDRSDCVRELLAHLDEQEDERAGQLLREIAASEEGRRFIGG